MTQIKYSCRHAQTITFVGHGGEAHTACSACGDIIWRGRDGDQEVRTSAAVVWPKAADSVEALLRSLPGVRS